MKYLITVSGKAHSVDLVSRVANVLVFSVEGKTYEVAVAPNPDSLQRSSAPVTQSTHAAVRPVATASVAGEVRAPMPGVVVQILVEVGATVALGAPVAIVEAMKMENTINSTKAGKVAAVHVAPKQQVNGGEVLLTIK